MTSHDALAADLHPVLACAASIESSLKSVAGLDPAFMSTDDKRTALVELTRLSTEMESLRLRVMVASGDVAEADGAPNVAAWLGPRTNTGAGANHRAEKLATSLHTTWTRVATALASGAVNVEQAGTIVAALERIAFGDVPDHVLAAAEAHLVELAADHTPHELRICGRKVLSVVAPQICEDEERKRLEEEEARVHARSRLCFVKRGNGTVELRATLSEAGAARLKGVIDSLTAPRHNNPGHNNPGHNNPGAGGHAAPAPLVDPATGKKVPADQRRGLAFEAFLEGLDPDALPVHGGNGTTLVITMELGDLLAGTGAATMPDGNRISAGQARRLACAARMIPAVLDGTSQVLDQGRAKRLFTRAQVTAMGIRDKTCRAEGCNMPARWCEAHHFTRSWAQGGATNLADGKLFCPFHHRCAHNPSYDMRLLPDGDVRFHKRT